MILGEDVVQMGTNYYNFTKFHQNQMKNKKVFLIARLMDVSSVKGLVKAQMNSACDHNYHSTKSLLDKDHSVRCH